MIQLNLKVFKDWIIGNNSKFRGGTIFKNYIISTNLYLVLELTPNSVLPYLAMHWYVIEKNIKTDQDSLCPQHSE